MDFAQFCVELKQNINEKFNRADESIFLTNNRAVEEKKIQELQFNNLFTDLNDEEAKQTKLFEDIVNELDSKRHRIEQSQNNLTFLNNKLAEIKKDNWGKTMKCSHFTHRKHSATGKLSQKDQTFLNSLGKKLLAYKYMTGIYWDYTNNEKDVLYGFARNPIINKVKTIIMSTSELTTEQVTSKMWAYITYINNKG